MRIGDVNLLVEKTSIGIVNRWGQAIGTDHGCAGLEQRGYPSLSEESGTASDQCGSAV